ncbi:MAG TPA: glycoside hydrolase family 2 TIM barrel-domain containing protein [Bacteroidales bacterium]|nr:glycoside hydrolase family 2 TIM barrel-domain containing protein [Bacteroidales bacterium]
MRSRLIPVFVIITGVMTFCTSEKKPGWMPAENPLFTTWGEALDHTDPWPEYPRPAMERKEWMSLNGLWDYAIIGKDADRPAPQGRILVPFPVESALSGVKARMTDSLALWYSREFVIPRTWKEKQIVLNFEASDWETTIWVDDNLAAIHRGGYDPFWCNITPYLSDRKKHTLVVKVTDPTDMGRQPRGKQVLKPGGIWYTPTSGIWQSVWLEPVEKTWIGDVRLVPDIDKGVLYVTVIEERCQGPEGCPPVDMAPSLAEVTLASGGTTVASESGITGTAIALSVQGARLWSPDDPYLYDLKIRLITGGEVTDEVHSYAGMRKISLGVDNNGFTRLMLNNEFIWQNGPLDQGFWPDGLYTPPSDEAMMYDIEMLKKMGFNMLRKHVKVENRRFYYHTDRLGLLVWQDMPSGDEYIWGDKPDITKSHADSALFMNELTRMIETKFNHPSIVMWVIYNEGWGQYDTPAVTDYVAALDTTRLVNSASGWTDRGTGHVVDIHHYPDPVAPEAEKQRAAVLGEFGGLGLPVQGHTWEQKNWGYEKMGDSTALLRKYEEFYAMVRQMVVENGMSASVYTQTTDVETETNGLMTYDRKIDKMGYANVRKAMAGNGK